MNKYITVICQGVVFIALFLLSFHSAICQSEYFGQWSGVFMNDFDLIFKFETSEDGHLQGDVKMFSNGNLIQDDQSTDIVLTDGKCAFFIPAKETRFDGEFNENITALMGTFVFPDGSKHEVMLNRKEEDGASAEEFLAIKEKTFSVPDLKEDMLFLFTSLKENHPQLYAYTSEDSLIALFNELSAMIKAEMTLEDFFSLTSCFVDAIKCSHTGVRLPSGYQQLVNSYGNFFPLKLYFRNNRAYFISDYIGSNIPVVPGDEVAAINGTSLGDIISRVFCFIPVEGNNSTTSYCEINQRFNSLMYFIDDSEDFKITYESGGNNEIYIAPSCSFAAIEKINAPNERRKPVYFEYLDNKDIGMIKIPSFGIRNMDEYFLQLDSIFGVLKNNNTPNLILDLRGNTGGHPIFAAQLLSYLTNHEFTYFRFNEDIPDFAPLYQPMQANPLSYKGNIYVCVDGCCLSTTGHLISLLAFNTNAVFVGEEPGSTWQCNDFSVQKTLPHSGIELNVPRTIFTAAVEEPASDTQFQVDYNVGITVGDIINKRDVYIEIIEAIVK